MYTLGKVIGGGLPVGAYGGRRDIMEVISPLGAVYQAGTLSGNPLAVAAGLATLRSLMDNPPYERLEQTAYALEEGLSESAKRYGVPYTINRIGSMFTFFFTEGPVDNYASATASNTALFAKFFHAMLKRGIYLPPSQFEAWFISSAHGESEIRTTLAAADAAMAEVSGAG